MAKLGQHLRGNLVAYLALFVALGGTGYAATNLPAGSVGTSQLRNGAVTPAKLSQDAAGGFVLAWAHVGRDGRVFSSSVSATVHQSGSATNPQPYRITWRGISIPDRCVPVVTPQAVDSSAGEQSTAALVKHQLMVFLYDAQGQYAHFPFYVAVIC